MAASSLIADIQETAIKPETDVASLLRKAKVAAVKLGRDDAIGWIDRELDGYDCKFEELPVYRKVHGTLKFFNPYHGLVPAHIKDKDTEEIITRAPISGGVKSIQELIKGKGELRYSMSVAHRNIILELFKTEFEPVLTLSKSQLTTIIERVTSLVLNWSLELEKAGVVGEGLQFTSAEKNKAGPITQNFFVDSIGFVGSSHHGDTKVSIKQRKIETGIDPELLAKFLDQAKSAATLLPSNLQSSVVRELDEISKATSDSAKSQGLERIKSIVENASGNLAAEGIIRLIASILG